MDSQDLPLPCSLILCVSQMEVITSLLADNAPKSGQWLRPSTSLRSKSINENTANTHFSADEREVELGGGGGGEQGNK